MLFAHGFGCDQNMWRFVAPSIRAEFQKCRSIMSGPAAPTLPLIAAINIPTSRVMPMISSRSARNSISQTVGHSVSAMIGVLGACKASDLFSRLALVGPLPRYINERDYVGGFTAAQIEELLEFWTAITWAGRRRWRH